MRLEDAANLFNQDRLLLVMTDHNKSLKKQQRTGGDPLQCVNSTTQRQLQLFAEAHSIKGLCLERNRFASLSMDPGYKSSDECIEEEQLIIDSFELSSQIAIKHSLIMLQYINNQEKSNSIVNQPGLTPASSNLESINVSANLNSVNNIDDNLDLINPLYEIALQKAPLLYIKRGCLFFYAIINARIVKVKNIFFLNFSDLQMGIRMFRDLLLKKNIQSITSIRQVLLKKFAECLMFNVAGSQYNILREPTTNEKYK